MRMVPRGLGAVKRSMAESITSCLMGGGRGGGRNGVGGSITVSSGGPKGNGGGGPDRMLG